MMLFLPIYIYIHWSNTLPHSDVKNLMVEMPLVKKNLTSRLYPSASLYKRPRELPYCNTLILPVVYILGTHDAHTLVSNIYVYVGQTLMNIVM